MSVRTAVTTLVLVGVSYVEASASIGYTEVAVKAVASSPAITVSVVSGSPDVKYIEPTFSAIYVEAKAQTSYIEVDVLAVPSKPAVIQVDVVNPLDSTIFGIQKKLINSVTPGDKNTVDFDGVLEDQVYFGEIFVPVKTIIRLFTDDFTAPDAQIIGYAAVKQNQVFATEDYFADIFKNFNNSVNTPDEADIGFYKELTNSVTSPDSVVNDLTKPFTNDVISSDVFDRTLVFSRTLDSSVAMLELAQAEYAKTETDSVTTSTYQVVDFALNTPDLLSILDSTSTENTFFRDVSELITAGDAPEIAISKVFNNFVTMLDSASVQVDYVRTPTETITFTETFTSVFPVLRDFADTATMNAYLSELNQSTLNSFVVGGKLGGDSIYIALTRYVPPISDSAGTSDSGSWVLQDYTSADYFAEDYVGTKGTI